MWIGSGSRSSRLLLLDLGIEQADKRRRIAAEKSQELRAQRLERGKIGDLLQVFGGDDFLLQHADLDLELLFLVEELLQDLRDPSRVFSADDYSGWAGQRGFELRQTERL